MFKNDQELKNYLKDQSNKHGISILNTYNTFFSRELLERLSVISYGEMIVKGSFSQLVHLQELKRPITDVDLVSREGRNIPLVRLFEAMYDNKTTIKYDLTKLPFTTKTGVIKLNLVSSLDKIKHPIQVDFKPNSNTAYEIQYKKVPKVFDKDREFYINVPSYEEHFAEKMCIIAETNKTDDFNTRLKDFYDIYKLHGGKYDNDKFSKYFQMMIYDRNRVDINKLSTNHLDEKFRRKHEDLWNNIKTKYEFLDKDLEFTEALYFSKALLAEQIFKLRTSDKTYHQMKVKKN